MIRCVLHYLCVVVLLGIPQLQASTLPHLLAASWETNNIIEIAPDGTTSTFVENLPGNVEGIAFDSAANVYLLLSGPTSSMVKVDPLTKAIVRTYPLDHEPVRGLIIRGEKAYACVQGKQPLQIDLENGTVTSLKMAGHTPSSVEFGPDGILYGVERGALCGINLSPYPNLHFNIYPGSEIKFDREGNLFGNLNGRIRRISPGTDGFFDTNDDPSHEWYVGASSFDIFDGQLFFVADGSLKVMNLVDEAVTTIAPLSIVPHWLVRRPVPNQVHGTVQIASVSISAHEEKSFATVSLLRSGGTQGTLNIRFATAGGSATINSDFVPTNGIIAFGPGETTKSITVSIVNDLFYEGRLVFHYVEASYRTQEHFAFYIAADSPEVLGTQVSAGILIEELDGLANLLWRHKDGRVAVWELEGNKTVKKYLFNNGEPVSHGLRFAGAADMNADGVSDLLWQRVDGMITVWFFSGTNRIGKTLLNGGQPVPWKLLAARDFNRDSHPDLEAHRRAGRIVVYERGKA